VYSESPFLVSRRLEAYSAHCSAFSEGLSIDSPSDEYDVDETVHLALVWHVKSMDNAFGAYFWRFANLFGPTVTMTIGLWFCV
jgi:hypothetical protein